MDTHYSVELYEVINDDPTGYITNAIAPVCSDMIGTVRFTIEYGEWLGDALPQPRGGKAVIAKVRATGMPGGLLRHYLLGDPGKAVAIQIDGEDVVALNDLQQDTLLFEMGANRIER